MNRFGASFGPAATGLSMPTSLAARLAAGDPKGTLFLDLSNEAFAIANVDSANGAFTGYVAASQLTEFSGIKHLGIVLTPAEDYVSVDAAALGARASLFLDAGERPDNLDVDYLNIDFSSLRNVIFDADAAGQVRSNYGTFANFEQYSIQLGAGVNSVNTGDYGDNISTRTGSRNTINSGDGVDEIASQGIDKVDAGGGYDFWFGTYTSTRTALTFEMHGSAGTLSNGSTLTNVESFSLRTGIGNDRFNIVDPDSVVGASIAAGGGFDALHADFSHRADHGAYASIGSVGEQSFSGYFRGDDVQFDFSSIEALTFVGGAGDDAVYLNTGAVTRAGGSLEIEGADGHDQVILAAARAGYTILPDGTGGLVINDIDPGNGDTGRFTMRDVETVAFSDQMVELTQLYALTPANSLMDWHMAI